MEKQPRFLKTFSKEENADARTEQAQAIKNKRAEQVNPHETEVIDGEQKKSELQTNPEQKLDPKWKIAFLRLDTLLDTTKNTVLHAITPYSPDRPIPSNESLSIHDMHHEAERLLSDSNLPNPAFLISATRLISLIESRTKEAETAHATAVEEESQADTALWMADGNLAEFEKKHPTKKFFDSLLPSRSIKKSILQDKDSAIERQTQAQTNIQSTEAHIQALRKIRDSLSVAIDQRTNEEIEKALTDMHKECTSAIHDLASDPQVLAMIRSASLKDVFEKISELETQSNTSTAQFKEIISTYINGGVVSHEELNKIETSLYAISSKEHSTADQNLIPLDIFHEYRNTVSKSLEEELFAVAVTSFIGTRIARFAQDLGQKIPTDEYKTGLLKKEMEKMRVPMHWAGWNGWQSLMRTAQDAPDQLSLKTRVLTNGDVLNSSSTLIETWQAVREIPVFSELFPVESRNLTDELMNALITVAPADTEGFSIDTMRYLPSPRIIRSLLLLSSAESGGYRRQHAFYTLYEMSKQSDWPYLLDQTIQAYPELEESRAYLEAFSSGDAHPRLENIGPIILSLRNSISALALNAYHEKHPTKEGKESLEWNVIAIQALSTKDILHVMTADPRFQPEVITQLSRALDILHDREKKNQSSDTPNKIGYSSIDYAIRKEYLAPILWEKEIGEGHKKTSLNLFKLAQAIEEYRDDPSVLSYLSSSEMISFIQSSFITDEKNESKLRAALRAHAECPDLTADAPLRHEFLSPNENNVLLDAEGARFLKKFVAAYAQYPVAKSYYLSGAGKGVLSFKDTLALPKEHPELCSPDHVDLLRYLPVPYEFFLGSPKEEVETFLSYYEGGSARFEKNQDMQFGQRLNVMQSRKLFEQYQLKNIVTNRLDKYFLYEEHSTETLKANLPDQWLYTLEGFIALATEERTFSVNGKAIQSLFEDPHVKNFCLEQVRMLWRSALETKNPNSIPYSLGELTSYIHGREGAGPLKHIESLGLFVYELNSKFLGKKDITPNTHKRVFEKQLALEQRLDKERWSDDDRSYLYALSTDILKSQPRLYSMLLSMFELLKPKELKMFGERIVPLMHAYIALIDKKTAAGKTVSSPDGVRFELSMRTLLGKMRQPGADLEEIMVQERLHLLNRIQDTFKDRFGIQKLPDSFDDQSTRSVQNIVRYLANITEKDAAKENTLSLYLSLLMSGQWEAFRRGDNIPLEGLFNPDRQASIEALISQKKSSDVVTADVLTIPGDSIGEFQKILQRDTEIYHTGSTQTIDTKVNALTRGIYDLLDPDLYSDHLEKGMLTLMKERGTAEINKILAKLFGRLGGKGIDLSDQEKEYEKEIKNLLESNKKTLSQETIKELQNKTKSVALATGIVEFINKTDVDTLLAELQNRLIPQKNTVEIFNKLGEEFTPSSGAQALSQDVDYLQNLIVKRGGELSGDERTTLEEYLRSITEIMENLEKIYGDVRERFEMLAGGSHVATNELLKKQISELQKVITRASLEQEIITVMTGNLNEIIENIRACLSCVTKGANNDTNLSFGDPIQFLLMSKSKYQKERGSIADEIVYLFPSTRPDGTKELSFVLDQIYGTKSSDMLLGHVQTVFKKYQELKKVFPEAQLSILVTIDAMRSAGIAPETLISRLGSSDIKATVESVENIEVLVPQSAMGDRYLEFGGGSPRSTGPRKTDGIRITI